MRKKAPDNYPHYSADSKIYMLWTVICLLCVLLPASSVQGQANAFTFGEKDSCEFYLNGEMPVYSRTQPIASDDPMRFFLSDDAVLPYEYGYVYRNINDYYNYDWITKVWSGTALRQDAGVLFGGNAASRTESREQDADPNDFSRILPYASIYIEPAKLGFTEGKIEYSFYSDKFALNCPNGQLSRNISITTGNGNISDYQMLEPAENSENKPKDWMGIVYTGGISKTVPDEDGKIGETVVQSEDGSPLFSVRYKNAARDGYGSLFDLVLSFTRFTFVSEADTEGALAVMESGNIFLAPLLAKDGRYTIELPAGEKSSDDEDAAGVRIGMRADYDYRLEDSDGSTPDGLILFSMNDLDNPSMAAVLQTDADWGVNELGQDFRWAEGFGVRRGAASFAVLPYYNHTIPNVYRTTVNSVNGDSSLVRISRMENSQADGTANGLYFSSNVTAASGYVARNDGNTADTGVSMLIYPEGAMTAGGSVGRRGSVSIPFFTTGTACKIEQKASKGGRIWSEDVSFRDSCRTVENHMSMKIVGSGADSVHFMEPDNGYQIYSIRIDEVPIRFDELKWIPGEDGAEYADFEISDEYGNLSRTVSYRFTRDRSGVVSAAFENIQDAHEISVTFYRGGLLGWFEILDPSAQIAVLIVVAYVVLMLAVTIKWWRNRKDAAHGDCPPVP